MRLTQKFLLTLPEDLYAELEHRRGLIKRNTYIQHILRVALSMPPESFNYIREAHTEIKSPHQETK